MRLLVAFLGAHQSCDQRGTCAVRQPHLGAVDGVVAVVGPLGGGLDRGDIGAEFGFAHRECAAHLTGGHSRQEMLLLLGGPVLADHVRDNEVGVDDTRHAHPAARQLFHAQCIGEQRLAQTAVLLRDHQPEQSHLLHALDDLGRVAIGVLEFLRDRDDLLVHECADVGQDLGLDLGEPQGVGESGHEISMPVRCGSRE